MSGDFDTTPIRGKLPRDIEAAVRTISKKVWGHPYREGEGVMHYAGGSYWHDHLLSLADEWERLAKAARIAARGLPHNTKHNREAVTDDRP